MIAKKKYQSKISAKPALVTKANLTEQNNQLNLVLEAFQYDKMDLNKIIYTFKNNLKDTLPHILAKAITDNDIGLLEKIGKLLKN